MTFTPTPEQLTIRSAATDTSDNLLISALAGAAKTSTLVLIAEALPKTSILCVAFNKKIADEMRERLPGNCESRTLNSLGHRAWGDSIGRRLTMDFKKTYRILTALIADLEPHDKKAAYELFSDITRAIQFGKSAGYVPTGEFPHAKRLMDDHDLYESLDEEPTKLMEDLIRAATIISIKEAYAGTVDFDDQVLMPTVFPATFPQFPLVLIDEAQDLSALNHRMLSKFARKRLIAVGDECQAIYGFRGAHEESMSLLEKQYSMHRLLLSISFRCPIRVVEEARWRAPHMRYPEWAQPGTVERLPSWSVDQVPDHAAIICRNNAPLFQMAMRILANGRFPELVGSDIGKTLVKWLKKLGDDSMSRTDTLAAIDVWETTKKAKAREPDKVTDQAECLRVFARQGKTLGEAVAYAEHVLAMAGPIKLMTGHKSKGLEFDHVFFLDEDLVGDRGQELNLRYVIQTRAKQRLAYVYSHQFADTMEETTDA